MLTQWQDAGLDRLKVFPEKFEIQDQAQDSFSVGLHTFAGTEENPRAISHIQILTITGDGTLQIENEVVCSPDLPFLPRIGLQFVIPAGFEEPGNNAWKTAWDTVRETR